MVFDLHEVFFLFVDFEGNNPFVKKLQKIVPSYKSSLRYQ